MKKMALHWQILIGMGLGVVAGLIFSQIGAKDFVVDWIKPFGTVFIKLLKLIAIPLIIASLIKGISDLKDISKFSKIGLRTILIYISTTVVAITIGLTLVNIIQPGNSIGQETVDQLSAAYNTDASARIETAVQTKAQGPLQFFVDIVPDNVFGAASDNRNMLQVIFFTILFGISLLLIKEEEARPIKEFFDGFNEVIMKMIDLIMLIAPYAVFALLAALIVETTNPDIFVALAKYAITVIIGLALMIGVYIIIVRSYVKKSPGFFLHGISPAQLLAYKTGNFIIYTQVFLNTLNSYR